MAAISGTDLALTTARVGAARVGSFRVGFIPCAVTGAGSPWFGEYIWDEVTPPTTQWTLQNEDCVCGQRPEAGFSMEDVSPPSTLAVTFVMDPDPNGESVDSTTAITFTPTVTPGVAPYTYDWDFGDGSAHSTDEIPVHTYSDPAIGGDYTATLIVTDANSYTATYSIAFPIAGI